MKLYHTTSPDRIDSILKHGLKPNSKINKSLGSMEYMHHVYNHEIPLFLSIEKGFYSNGVVLEIDSNGIELIADIPSLMEASGNNYGSKGIYVFPEKIENISDRSKFITLGGKDKFITYKELNDSNSEAVKIASQITKTFATKQNISPDKIRIIETIKEATPSLTKNKAARKFLRQVKAKNPDLFYDLVQKAEWFLNKNKNDYKAKELRNAFKAELNKNPELDPSVNPDTYGIKLAIDAVADEKEDATSAKRLFGNTLDQVFKEEIELDIDVGDTILGGRFKNKKVIVKNIGKDDLNQPTVNDRPLLKYRIKKDMPEKKTDSSLKETYKEELITEDPITLGVLGTLFTSGIGAGLYKKFKPKYKQKMQFDDAVFDLANGIIESSDVTFALMAYNEAKQRSDNKLSAYSDEEAFHAYEARKELYKAIKAEIPLHWDMEKIASDYNFDKEAMQRILNEVATQVMELILENKVQRLTEEEWREQGGMLRLFQMGDSLPKGLKNAPANNVRNKLKKKKKA